MDFSVFLFLFLSFNLFNLLSGSVDWGAELVAVKSTFTSPLELVVGVVRCSSSSNVKSRGSEAIMLSNSLLSGSCSAINVKIDGEDSSLEETLPSAIANFVCLRASLLCVLVLPGTLGTAIDQSDADFTFCRPVACETRLRPGNACCPILCAPRSLGQPAAVKQCFTISIVGFLLVS